MTSKISLAKLLKESMKRNLAFGAFLLLVYFCYFPVGSLLAIQSYRQNKSFFDLNREILFYGAENPFLLAAAGAAAVVLGILQYAYLHSREKTDFYHSFPVRRELLFGIQYLAGLLIWMITYGVNLILFLLVCMANGIAGLTLLKAVVINILAQTVSFLLSYSLMILSMMLTGKVFAAVMGFGTICLYAPSAGGLLNLMMEVYFDTYSPQYGVMNTTPVFLTPVYAIGKLGGFWDDTPDMRWGISGAEFDLMLGILLAAVLTALVCVLLYRKRASEAAGKTMAFSAAARAVKFLLVVPLALATQLFLYEVTGGSTVWGLFGLLFGLLVSSALVEFVYTMDIREIFRDKKQLLLSAAAALMILTEFQLDLTGYDQWMPSKDEVAEVELKQSSLAYTSRSIYTRVDNGTESWYNWERLADDKWYSTTDLDPVYELLAHSNEVSGRRNQSDGEYTYPLLVTWRMQNGAARTRTYTFHEEEMITYFSDICNSEEYRETVYPILKDGETLEELSVLGTDYGYLTLDLTKEQLSTFLDTFKKELRSVTFEERTRGFEIRRIDVKYRASDGTLYGEEYALLKGAFPETMELLRDYDHEEYGNAF